MSNRTSHKPLEWVGLTKFLIGTVNEQFILDLNLTDEEVAEIWAIDSNIDIDMVATAVDDDLKAEISLSMDPTPGIDNDPTSAAIFEDLEVFFTHQYALLQDVGTPSLAIRQTDNKQLNLMGGTPILVGTNVGMLCLGDPGGVDINYRMKIYFTRKKAGRDELARILLKRR